MNSLRRSLLAAIGTATAASVAGCSQLRTSESDSPAVSTTGHVRSVDGEAVEGAHVELLGHPDDLRGETRTDSDGHFSVDYDGASWLRVSASGYQPRVKAVHANTPSDVALTPADGVISLTFGGDVMFGRRFYDPPEDSLRPRFELDDTSSSSHRQLLRAIEPRLQSADITSVNLETPLTTSDYRHPEKLYAFVSHPSAARALSDAGVDYACLGNNHTYDALEPGLEDTFDALDEATVAHSGAGFSSADAWEPAIVERDGLSVALLSCTTVTGQHYEIDWSADHDTGTQTVELDGSELVVDGTSGVASGSPEQLAAAVEAADRVADIVVVGIHGGDEYQRTPTDRVVSLTDRAITAGADIVANHHPHVLGGIEQRNGALVAWSLGNMVFDQELWTTFPTGLLGVDIDSSGVVRWDLDPVLIDGYKPAGVAGPAKRRITRLAASYSEPSAVLGTDRITGGNAVTGTASTETVELELDAGLYACHAGSIDAVVEGDLTVGRERLLTGGFEDTLVNRRYAAPLWRLSRDGESVGEALGYDGSGIRLRRNPDHTQRALLSPSNRLPITGSSCTVTGRVSIEGDGNLSEQFSWYDDTSGGSFTQDEFEFDSTDGDWKRFRRRLDVPDDATHVDWFVFLAPGDVRQEVRFDDLRLIEWADSADSGVAYDHVFVPDAATVEISAPALGTNGVDLRALDGLAWTPLDN